MTYYFTYESDERFPFQSGWTEVEAESYDQAVEGFQAFHPNRPGSDFINCAGIYGEDSFNRKRMAKEGNLGKKCVERIRVSNHKSTKTTDDNLVEKRPVSATTQKRAMAKRRNEQPLIQR